MTRFRKKPVIIEAFRYDGAVSDRRGKYIIPQWAVRALHDGTLYYQDEAFYIKTLEGSMHVSLGDYIIRGVRGELYPCKPDIFVETYERV